MVAEVTKRVKIKLTCRAKTAKKNMRMWAIVGQTVQVIQKDVCKNVQASIRCSMKTISVTIICKNEQDTLPRLIKTITFADEIIVADTGSTDNTAEVARALGAKTFFFAWRDDFSAARNYAISKANCDYVMWLDADDVIPDETAKAIQKWKTSSHHADFVYMRYKSEDGSFWFWRERIIRRCKKCRFKGFIHEAIVPFGQTEMLFADVVHKPTGSHEQRNYQMYQRRLSAGKRLSAREKYYYARTLSDCGKSPQVKNLFLQCAQNKRLYNVNRADSYLQVANICLAEGNLRSAYKFALRSVALCPSVPQAACTVAYCLFLQQNYAYAEQWYLFATLARPVWGFNSNYYSAFLPYVQLSVCCYRQGKYSQAAIWHKKAKALCPDSPTVLANDKYFSVFDSGN